ncbi:receptor-like protein EIX1 [Cajanus cajan]|uniref:receptor-like protein EIX1 n=1 Tax=Cajanus cajan TaxID=3821 RepID=UPI0010FBB8D4|nr:receptor-like protein EIX1 [Cajanus cajan]
MLSTWSDGDNNTNCCKWRGIQCHNETGHVLRIDLHGGYLNGGAQYLDGAINLTSLIDLHNIQHLDLSNNDFLGSHIQELIGSFTNLTYLNLSYSRFGGSIPCELGKLTHLQYLDLSNNFLDGEIPYQLGNISQLRYLDLSGNSFSGALPFQVGNLPFLHTLGLAGNFDVKSKDAEWFSNLYSLTILRLDYFHNLGSSHHWLQMINKLFPNLRELRLVNCSLLDTDLQSLFYSGSNFSSSLAILDLSSNMLTSSSFQLLLNISLTLQELYLSHNNIVFSFSVFPSFPSLMVLDLSYNNMTSLVFQDGFNIGSKLQNLYLYNCSLMNRSFLMSSTSVMNSSSSVVSLDLSSNLLNSSTIFYWLFYSTTNLRSLYLYDNMLEGPIPDGFGKVMNSLETLDLYRNKLQGKIPSSIGNMCRLQILDLSHNKLNGEIPSFIENSSCCNQHIYCQTSNLTTLILSSNQITGELPNYWKSVESLLFLDLSNNKLSGKIPMSMGTLVNLKAMELGNNNLTGELPSTLKSCRNLIMLDVGENKLSGPIPSWIGESMQQLIIFIMRGNHFSGNLPIHLCYLKYIQLLDLSRNYMSGGIPTCLKNFTVMAEKSIDTSDTKLRVYDAFGSLNSNGYTFEITWMWKGVEQGFRGPELNLKSIDLSCNNLTGEIPKEIVHLLWLVSLNLARNNLSGEIPSEIGNLSSLDYLNLSRNHFSGRIPSSLAQIDGLGKLVLSHNSLSGRIPMGRHFQTYDASSFEGNVDLCGEQINKSCPGDGDRTTTVKPEEAAGKGKDSDFYEALYMSMGVGYFIGFWGLIGPILVWRPWRNAYLMFLNRFIGYMYVWLRTLW